MKGERKPPLRIFISYAHEDMSGRERLEKHLSPLRRAGLIEIWTDAGIRAGQYWNDQIEQHLRASDVIVFLLSADFAASDFCYQEIEIAFEQERDGLAVIIPVLLHAVMWSRIPLANHQLLPRDGQPIEDHDSPDQAFTKVVEELQKTCEALLEQPESEDSRITPPLLVREPEPVKTITALGQTDASMFDPVSRLYNRGVKALEEARPLVAINFLRRALALAEGDLRSEPDVLTDCRRSLAEAYRLSGDLDTAQNLAESATASARSSEDSLMLIAGLNESALVLMSREEWEAAKVKLLEALTVGTLSGCGDTRELAVANHNLALVLAHLGALDRAEDYLHRTIAIDERYFPASHPEVALDHNTLGLIYQARGRLRAARQQFKRAYKDLASTLGLDHPHTMAAKMNLAEVATLRLPMFR